MYILKDLWLTTAIRTGEGTSGIPIGGGFA